MQPVPNLRPAAIDVPTAFRQGRTKCCRTLGISASGPVYGTISSQHPALGHVKRYSKSVAARGILLAESLRLWVLRDWWWESIRHLRS